MDFAVEHENAFQAVLIRDAHPPYPDAAEKRLARLNAPVTAPRRPGSRPYA